METLDATKLSPAIKHQTILQTFEDLAEGGAFILHNDHDPKPLYYQMNSMYGNSFSWEYLQEGPQDWEVRITKHKGESGQSLDFNKILDATMYSPMIRHDAIFDKFDELEENDYFILQNNHDPRPVYFQMSEIFGDTFSWEYLKQGPDIFQIKITKFGEEELSVTNGERLDVTQLEPRKKHPTILGKFELLKEDECFIIHNDHDPSPLKYQMLAEFGDIFIWEYLQEGPVAWEVMITKKKKNNNNNINKESEMEQTEIKEITVGELVTKDYRKAEIFRKYGIDFCCNGHKSVKVACQETGVDYENVMKDLENVNSNASFGQDNANKWEIDFLADYVVNNHHSYVRENAPILLQFTAKIAQVHGGHHPELLSIKDYFETVVNQLMDHMEKEENHLFPYIKEMVVAKKKGSKVQKPSFGTAAEYIAKMEAEHDEAGEGFKEITKLSSNYSVPADGCNTYRVTYAKMEEFELDLHRHIHLENNILFKKAIEMEKEVLA